MVVGMRLHVFVSGAAIVALGFSATKVLEKAAGFGFLQGALTLGGGMIICGLFSLKSRWHGIIGAGIMALLGLGRGLGNLPDVLKLAQGSRERGAAPVMELGVTVICLFLLLRVIRALQQERTRRLMEQEEAEEQKPEA